MVSIISRVKRRLTGTPSVIGEFQNPVYNRINSRRHEHLASLHLPLEGRSVLEVGAGIGDHTGFFVDRGCTVTVTEPRDDCLGVIRARFPDFDVRQLDLNNPPQDFVGKFDIVYAYGVLYHLQRPAEAIAWMARHCSELLLLETCVSYGDDAAANLTEEDARIQSQAISGIGCRPTRPWVAAELKRNFEYVYFAGTQPAHEQFPTDWSTKTNAGLSRAVFVASRAPIDNPLLLARMPMIQTRN